MCIFQKRLLSFIVLFFALFISPSTIYANDYGTGVYGGGDYNVGGGPASNSLPGPTECNDKSPISSPVLYAATPQDGNTIILYFTGAIDPVTYYAVEYGNKSGYYPWGSTDIGDKDVRNYLVKELQPNTTYYFRVRAGNGCATGEWSNEISVTTKGLVSFSQLNTTNISLNTAQVSEAETCETYTVQSGDTLWSIATNVFGDGSKYVDIKDLNQGKYPSLQSSDSLKTGWELKTKCTSNEKEQAGYKVNIKVLDKDQNPIKGAKVTIHSDPQEATTNEEGIASFENVEEGEHRVLVSYNFHQGEQAINLTGDVKEINVNITIEMKSIMASPIVVTVVGALSLAVVVLGFLLIRSKKKKSSL